MVIHLLVLRLHVLCYNRLRRLPGRDEAHDGPVGIRDYAQVCTAGALPRRLRGTEDIFLHSSPRRCLNLCDRLSTMESLLSALSDIQSKIVRDGQDATRLDSRGRETPAQLPSAVTTGWRWISLSSHSEDRHEAMITDSDPNGERGYGLPNPLVEEWLLDHYVRSVPLLSDTDTFEEIEDVVRKYHQLPFRTSGEAQERLASHHWEDGGGPQLPLALYDLLQRVNEVYPSQDGKQIQLKLCVLAHQEVKTVRCFEFDRLQQHPGELPFTGIAKGLQDHYWHLERIHRSKTRSNRQTEQAETWAACSVAYANWEIADCSRKLQRDPDLVDVARKGRDGMMHRLQAYPVGVEVDLAYTVAIKGLLHELVHRFGDVHGGRTFANMRVFSSNPPNRNLALDACDSEFDVHLPVLLINHQSQASRDKLQTETRNKQRVAVASAAWFFRTMGIVDFPVYGLAVCGSRGYLTQAWYSDAHNCCYLVDRNILENPLDLEAEDGEPRVYNFLSRLNEHAKQLEEHFNASREQVYARAQSQDSEAKLPFLDWTALSQMEQYQGEFSTSDEDEL